MVADQEPIQNGRFDLLAGPDLPRRADPFHFGRGLDVVANEPAAEPAWCDLLNDDGLTTLQRSRNRSQIHLVSDVKVFKALTNAPFVWATPPVELLWRQRLGERDCTVVGGVELGNQAQAPGGRYFVKLGGHVSQ